LAETLLLPEPAYATGLCPAEWKAFAIALIAYAGATATATAASTTLAIIAAGSALAAAMWNLDQKTNELNACLQKSGTSLSRTGPFGMFVWAHWPYYAF
jgi:hypothetical protein